MPAIKETAPGRLEIREGGGCLALFGLPFFATGIFMLLASVGVITMRSDGEPVTQATMVLLGVLFTLVGGVLAFGRAVAAIDVGQHVITKQWRILVPVRTWTYQLGDYTTVTLAFVRGDSDSADKYPIGLKGNTVAPLPLCSPTQYAESRQCAAAVARHLGLDIEDTSTDHPSRVTANELDAALQERLRSAGSTATAIARPPVLTSEVSDDSGTVRIAIPTLPLHPLAIVGGLFPSVVAASLLGWLGVLSSPRPLTPAERIFFGVLFVGFGLLPAVSVAVRWLRSRVGRTIVTISTEELRVQQRGIFRTRMVTSLRASEILDVDYSTKESMMTSARRSAEAEASTMRQIPPSSSTAGPNTEWVFAILNRFLKGRGIVVKTRAGLTTFGEGLADDEIQYLHALIQRALAGGAA
jgi:hypothetical protein